MPELPDVEVFRKEARKALNQKINRLTASRNRMFRVSQQLLRRHLLGRTFTHTYRRGKYLFLRTSAAEYLVLHFGMTGDLEYYKDDPPDHTILRLHLQNGRALAVITWRKLGFIDFVTDKKTYTRKLGKDAFSFTSDEFVSTLRNSRGTVKKVLMEQKLIAGIGNIYADEIFYHMPVNPKKTIERFSKKQLVKLYNTMNSVLKTAIRAEVEPDNFPRNWLALRRWPGENCGICSGKIKKEIINSRSCYYCPKHQRK